MTETLRDRLAAVLGPGNDDHTAYTQADAVLNVLYWEPDLINDILIAMESAENGPYPPNESVRTTPL